MTTSLFFLEYSFPCYQLAIMLSSYILVEEYEILFANDQRNYYVRNFYQTLVYLSLLHIHLLSFTEHKD